MEMARIVPTNRCIRAYSTAKWPGHTEVCSSARRSLSARAASEESRESTSSLDEESRLEALERGVRRKQGVCRDHSVLLLLQLAVESLSQADSDAIIKHGKVNEALYA